MVNLNRTLIARFQGPGFEGEIAWSDFSRLIDGLQKSLVIIGEDLVGRTHQQGRVPKSISDEVSLNLVATRLDSFVAELALPARGQASRPDMDFAEDALEVLLEGIEALLIHGRETIPEAAIQVMRRVWPKQDVSYTVELSGGRNRRRILIDKSAVEAMLTRTRLQTHFSEVIQIAGRLLEANFNDGTAAVWDASGRMIRVHFEEGLADQIQASIRRQVFVSGNATSDDAGNPGVLYARTLDTLGVADDFWRHDSLEELMLRQQVKPWDASTTINSAEFIDENIDEIMEELRSIRRL